MQIRPSSALRNEYTQISELAKASGEPIFITNKGEDDGVYMSMAAYEEREKMFYLPPAQHDFEEIAKYHITEAGTPYARKIYSTMKTTINRLRDFPLMGQTHPDPILAANGYRKLVLTKTYVAVYKVIGDTVYIYAIVNGATDYPRLLK